MNGKTIGNFLCQNPITKRCLAGVIASDELPKQKPAKRSMLRDTFYVVNLDPKGKDGSHWVVCFLKKNSRDLFFDSYGFPPVIDRIKDFMGTNFTYIKEPVQHPLSTACGQWCLFFVWYELLGKSRKDFLERFNSEDLLKNDHEINDWINRTFDKNFKVLDKEFLNEQIAKSFAENRQMDVYNLLLDEQQ